MGINEHHITLRIQLIKNQHATIISTYESALDVEDETK